QRKVSGHQEEGQPSNGSPWGPARARGWEYCSMSQSEDSKAEDSVSLYRSSICLLLPAPVRLEERSSSCAFAQRRASGYSSKPKLLAAHWSQNLSCLSAQPGRRLRTS